MPDTAERGNVVEAMGGFGRGRFSFPLCNSRRVTYEAPSYLRAVCGPAGLDLEAVAPNKQLWAEVPQLPVVNHPRHRLVSGWAYDPQSSKATAQV